MPNRRASPFVLVWFPWLATFSGFLAVVSLVLRCANVLPARLLAVPWNADGERLTKPPSTYILVLPFAPLLCFLRGPLCFCCQFLFYDHLRLCILELVFGGPLHVFFLSLSLSCLLSWAWQSRNRQTAIILFLTLFIQGVHCPAFFLANDKCYGENGRRQMLCSIF